jgi:Flp pilus assembly protein TadB
MATNILLAFMTGVGIFLIVISQRWGRGRQNLRRIAALRRTAKETLKPEPGEENFVKAVRASGLEVALAQADLAVTPAGFIRVGILLALVALALGYLVSGGLLVAVFLSAGSIVLYVYWLQWRRDEKKLEYEEALADMCDRISAGATLTSTLQGAMTHAAETAPEILKTDFNFIAAQLTQTGSVRTAFADIVRRRRSYSLELLASTLEVWSIRGATMRLQQVLAPLSTTIRAMATEGKRMNSELSGARMTLMIVAIAPAFFVLLLRLTTPSLDAIYASPSGQVIQIVAYAIAGAGFMIGQRILQRVRRVMEIEAA